MSIRVKQIVLHQLRLNEDIEQGNQVQQDNNKSVLQLRLRENPLDVGKDTQQMMLQLHQSYQAKMLGYGVFSQNSLFAQKLNLFLQQELDFLSFSQYCAELLRTELSKYIFATNGTFVFCHYTFLATEYLFIAFVDSCDSVIVNEALDIQQISYLNLTQFDIAARINLTDLSCNAHSERYLSFIKGRIGRKVSDFFMDFLGAESHFDTKQQNLTLLQAVDDYCQSGSLQKRVQQDIKKQAFDYCKKQQKSGEEIILDDLSQILPEVNQQNFRDFTHNKDYQLAESIPPVTATLKTLATYSGTGKGISISFDSVLLDERVFWDPEEDSLCIKGLPANLRDQLQRFVVKK